jgi:hypothetical protein
MLSRAGPSKHHQFLPIQISSSLQGCKYVRLLYIDPLTPPLLCSQVDTNFFLLLVQVNLAIVSAAENHLPLEHPQVYSQGSARLI